MDANGVCQKTELVDLKLLNVNALGGVRIQSKLSTSLLQGATYSSAPNAQACPYNNSSVDECLVGMQVGVEKPSGPNGLHLGITVADLLKQVPPLVGDVKNAEFYGVLGGVLGVLLNALLGGVSTLLNVIVTVVTALLAPLLNTIGGVLDLLLQGLGIELGRATVEVLKIQCDTAQIVQ